MTVQRIRGGGGFRPPKNPLVPLVVVVCLFCGSGVLALGVVHRWPASGWAVGLMLTVITSIISVLAQYWFYPPNTD